MLISTLNNPCTQIIHATGKIKAYQITFSVIITSILPISWVVLQHGGSPISVFVVSIIMTFINQVVSLFMVRRVFKYSIIEYSKIVLLPCLMVSVLLPIIPFIITKIIKMSFVRLVIVCVLDVVIAIVITFVFVLTVKEKKTVLYGLSKTFKKL